MDANNQSTERDANGAISPVEGGNSLPETQTPRKKTRRKARTFSASQTGTETKSILVPNGSKPELSEADVTIVETTEPPAESTPFVSSPLPEFSVTSSAVVLVLLDGIVSMAFGPKCTMTKDEKKMLSEPLDRMLKRLPVNIGEKFGMYVDPLLFTMGLVAWGSRISRIRKSEHEHENETAKETHQSQKDSNRNSVHTGEVQGNSGEDSGVSPGSLEYFVPEFISQDFGSSI